MGWCYTTKITLKLRIERRQRYQEKIPIISWKFLFVIVHLFVVSFISLTNFDKRLSRLWLYTLSLAVPFTIFPLFRKKIFYKTPPSYTLRFSLLYFFTLFFIFEYYQTYACRIHRHSQQNSPLQGHALDCLEREISQNC